MSTQDKGDKDWDDIFRKSLDQPDIPFDPGAWTAMEKKLDQRQATRNTYRKGFFGMLLLLLLCTTTWYVWPEKTGQTENKEGSLVNTKETNAHARVANKQTEVSKNAAVEEASAKQEPGATRMKGSESAVVEEAENFSQLRTRESLPSVNNEPNKEAGRMKEKAFGQALEKNEKKHVGAEGTTENEADRSTLPSGNQDRRAGKRKLSTGIANRQPLSKPNTKAGKRAARIPYEKKSSSETVIAKSFGEKKAFPVLSVPDEGAESGVRKAEHLPTRVNEKPDGPEAGSSDSFQPDRALAKEETALLAIRMSEVIDSSSEGNLEQLPARHPGIRVVKDEVIDTSLAKRRNLPEPGKWSINLMVAPDLSTVGFNGFTRPGMSQGLTLEYQLFRRLSLQVGVLYSSKIYFAGPDDYQPAKPWAYGKPDRIDGKCHVLDLPINLRYRLVDLEKNAFYVGAGISSYLMQSEKYDYIYNGYHPVSWSAPERNRHWLGVVNLSLVYERQISGRFSLLVEPYLKTPLAGVGAGKVKLATTGAFLILKYRL
jgi:hypothetical protein